MVEVQNGLSEAAKPDWGPVYRSAAMWPCLARWVPKPFASRPPSPPYAPHTFRALEADRRRATCGLRPVLVIGAAGLESLGMHGLIETLRPGRLHNPAYFDKPTPRAHTPNPPIALHSESGHVVR